MDFHIEAAAYCIANCKMNQVKKHDACIIPKTTHLTWYSCMYILPHLYPISSFPHGLCDSISSADGFGWFWGMWQTKMPLLNWKRQQQTYPRKLAGIVNPHRIFHMHNTLANTKCPTEHCKLGSVVGWVGLEGVQSPPVLCPWSSQSCLHPDHHPRS